MDLSHETKLELEHRVATLRNDHERLRGSIEDTRERARLLAEATKTSRHLRWTIRYEQAFERHAKQLSDLTIG